jgi:hypothetical protein
MKQYTLTNPMAAKRTLKPKVCQSPVAAELAAPKKAEVICLGVDVHPRQQVVCRKIDGACAKTLANKCAAWLWEAEVGP